MITTKIVPAHILRLFVWEVCSLNTSMEKINEIVPIVPLEDEPKLSDSGKAYIIYGYSENQSTEMDEIRNGVISFRIIAPTFSELVQISNVIASAFESTSRATEAVNIWSSQYSNNALVGIRFTRAKTSFVEEGEPADSEGGPVDSVVSINYSYVRNQRMELPVNSGLWS